MLLPDGAFGAKERFLLVADGADGATKWFLIVSDSSVDTNEKM